MGYFDLETAIKALGEGADPIDAFSIAFGVPQCMIDIGKSAALAFLPSSIILSISDQVQKGRQSASENVYKLKKKLLLENGFFEFETESGTFRFKSDFSKAGTDSDAMKAIGKLGGMTSSLAFALQYGTDLYTNYKEVEGIINGISDCLDTYKNFLKLNNGPSAQMAKNLDPNYAVNTFGLEMAKMQESLNFIKDADQVISNCAKIIVDRINDPSLEPQFADPSLVSGLGFNVATSSTPVGEPIFRLVYGPPKSKTGQFLLSVDGLYYDSQTGGVPEVISTVSANLAYKFEQDANQGGKGTAVSKKALNAYLDTIFDLTKIDESPGLQAQYDADHFLSVLKGQKNKNIEDLKNQVNQAIALYGADTAVVINLKQSINSVVAKHEAKINKRKKQIEVAVKAPYVFGKGSSFLPGEVPINDFSYLKDINLSVAFDNQKKLIFKQGEVSGVVLPLHPIFVKSQEAENVVHMDHLVVPPVGTGAIVYDSDSLGTGKMILSLNDKVVTDGLVSIYNFLEGETVAKTSDRYKVLNCASGNNYGNAQLVAGTTTEVFSRGLAIPYLGGVTVLNGTTGAISDTGSYLRLPDTTELQNLTYNHQGFTFESWVYIPGFDTVSTSKDRTNKWGSECYYKLLLANENNGGIDEEIDPDTAPYSNNSDIVRGMVIGFTRDRQITLDSPPSDVSSDNSLDNVKFFIAPTRSVNASDVGFVNKQSVINCTSGYEVLKCAFDCSEEVNGVKFNDVSGTFMYITVTVDVENNEVRLLCDGNLMTTSSIHDVFGVPDGTSPKIPSFKEINSFTNGLTINSFFTPWIVGGGWTDGIDTYGFMGSRGGKKSGLNGHVGSVKIYNRPLTTEETLDNFKAQRGFFKNIDLT